jgi:glutamate dehydrogenase/leucine dehydrogenase
LVPLCAEFEALFKGKHAKQWRPLSMLSRSMLGQAFAAVRQLAEEKGTNLRTAAYCLALQRIAAADVNRGHY